MTNEGRDAPEGGVHKECNRGEMSVRQEDDVSEGRSRWSDVECVSGYDKLHQLSCLIILSLCFLVDLVCFWFLIGWLYSLSLYVLDTFSPPCSLDPPLLRHTLPLHLLLSNHCHSYQSALTGPCEKKRERESFGSC